MGEFQPFFAQLTGAGNTVRAVVLPAEDKLGTPFAMGRADRDGACVLVVTVTDNAAYSFLMEGLSGGNRFAFIEIILAHESAHCLQQQAGTKTQLTIEPEADAFAVLWMRVNDPEHAHAGIRKLKWLRSHFPQPGGKYDRAAAAITAAQNAPLTATTISALFTQAHALTEAL